MNKADQVAASRKLRIAGFTVKLPAEAVKRVGANGVSYDLRPLYAALKEICEPTERQASNE